MEGLVPLNLKAVALKCRSKKEMYDVLMNDCGVYLPPIEYANAAYIRNIMTGKIKFIKCSEVKIMQAPHIDTLTIKQIMIFAKSKFDLDDYLPTYTKFRWPSRPWLCNIVHTMVGDEFKEWIQKKMSDREKCLVMKKNFNVKVLPELAEKIERSNRVSLISGRSHFLLRAPTHKRMKVEEVKELVASNNKMDIENAELFSEIQEMKERLNEFKARHLEDMKYKEVVDQLIQEGVLNNDGSVKIKF